MKTEVGRAAGVSHNEPTRLMYAAPLRKFGRLITDMNDARAWIRASRAEHDALAGVA